MAGWSNAPCLFSEKGKRCYKRVLSGTGYCEQHQKPPFEKAFREEIPGWGNIKRQVLLRDKGICYLCGAPGADQVDHLTPVSEGGSSKPMNLKAVHGNVAPFCHRKKSAQQTAQHKKRINTFKTRGKRS